MLGLKINGLIPVAWRVRYCRCLLSQLKSANSGTRGLKWNGFCAKSTSWKFRKTRTLTWDHRTAWKHKHLGLKATDKFFAKTFEVNIFTLKWMDVGRPVTFDWFSSPHYGLQLSRVVSRIFVFCLLHTIVLDGLMIIATRWEVECWIDFGFDVWKGLRVLKLSRWWFQTF